MNTQNELPVVEFDEMSNEAKSQAMADFTANERRVFTFESLIQAWSLHNLVTVNLQI